MNTTESLHRSYSRRLALALLCGLPLPLAVAAEANSRDRGASVRNIIVNATRLGAATIGALEQRYRLHIPNGRYWYDKSSGAWGRQGGPTLGFTLAGLDLGGPLRADASGGKSRIFINGRELPRRDVAVLQQILRTPIARGRYWLDASGNAGHEGEAFLVNLFQVARAAGRGRGGAWSAHTRTTDAHVGGDGKGFLFYIDRDSSGTSD